MVQSLEQLINQQIQKWEMFHGDWNPSPEVGGAKGELFKPAIAISPQFGCGTRKVADLLSRRTGSEVYGFKLIDKVAENMHVRRRLIDHLDQSRHSEWKSFVADLLRENRMEQTSYFRHLVQVLEAFVLQGDCILLGRGAPFVVRPGMGLRVRLVAPAQRRIRNLMHYYGIDEAQARERMERYDCERAEFAKRHYHRDIDDPNNYDLTLNLDRMAPETAANVILHMLESMHMHGRTKMFFHPASETAEEIVSRQIDKWERATITESESDQAEETADIEPPSGHLPVVAFSTMFCSGSRLVADELRLRLGYEIFGYKMIDKVAEDMDLKPKIVDRLDQQGRTALQSLVDALLGEEHVSREKYFRSLVGVIRALIVQGGVTLLGRGSTFLVEPGEGLRVKLCATEKKRLENAEKFYDIDGATARERLARSDKERDEFTRQYFKADRTDLTLYDMTFSMDRLTPATVAETIRRGLEPLQG